MVAVGTILWAANRPSDHNDHLHVEPPTKKSGTPPLTNPGMTPGIRAIYDALTAEFGHGEYFLDSNGRYVGNDPGVDWTFMGGWNRRKIAGSNTWSQHAWWNALDIGPYVGRAAQQRFYDFLTGQFEQGDDEMLVARLMVVEAGSKGWLPTQEAINYWLIRADNLDNPEFAAEWRRDFEPMWARETQNEYLLLQRGLVEPKPAASTGVTLDQVRAEINKARVQAG